MWRKAHHELKKYLKKKWLAVAVHVIMQLDIYFIEEKIRLTSHWNLQFIVTSRNKTVTIELIMRWNNDSF